ncbi:invasion associated locus B family protein [Paracoccus sp. DMF-8]|uniref:invasion associated locus B family protein n=1 Tax=Paracoccus sp. DMF-8 TaxID=3019445 RepID=UPI0023E86759|nr:invasion associated locus B family protein [Paracoccus sp. DMF-8]MDF3606469.1 invasion associated locus B family protein [Paracoccus sp. DMF-8]
MVDKTSTALIAALFSVAAGAGMAFAQEAATTTEAPAAEAAAPAEEAPAAQTPAAEAPAAEAPAAETPAGETAEAPAAEAPAEGSGDPQPGQSYIRRSFGDWSMRCIKTPDDKDPCELYQLLRDADGGAVAEASVVPVEGEIKAIVTFVAPLETDLQQGLRMQIDQNAVVGYPFMVCAQIGCISRVGLNESELGAYKRGNAGNITLQPFGVSPDRAVKLGVSLKGFTAGLDAVTKALAELGPAPTTEPAPAGEPAAPAAAAE